MFILPIILPLHTLIHCRFDETTSSLQLINLSTKKKGEEIFAVYGTYPNSKLAYSYGFVIPGNAHQVI